MFAPYAIDKLPIGIGIGRYHIQNFGEKLKNREGFYFTLMYKNCSSWLKFFLLYSCQFAQAKLGTCQILNFAQNPRQSQSVQDTELNLGGGTPHRKSVYREGGTPHIFSEQGANKGGWTPHMKTGSQ